MKILFKVSMVLILTIILSVCTITSSYASECDIKVSSPESVNIGRSFSANFSLANEQASNVSALKMVIEYNVDSLNFKSADCSQGEVDFNDENGKVTVICLFTGGIANGDSFMSLSFTAKTGQDSCLQKINFRCIEAVDNNLNNISFTITESLEITITKSSSGLNSSVKADGSNKNISSTSGKSSSKSSSSKADKSGVSGNKSERNKSGYDLDEEETMGNIAGLPSIGYLSNNNGKNTYLFAGVGIGVSVVAVIFIAYKIGKTDRLKDDESSGNSDKEMNETDNL